MIVLHEQLRPNPLKIPVSLRLAVTARYGWLRRMQWEF